MLLGVLIINEHFAVLSITTRLLPRNMNNIKPASQSALGLAEDVVDFLEGTVGGFWVEEVDDREDECVDYGEDYVSFVADGAESDRGDHDDHEVEGPEIGISLIEKRISQGSTYQFAEVERPFAGARIFRGTISAG